MGNELSIDLRLALRKLREDIRDANRMIKEGLNKSLNLGGSQDKSSKEAGDSMDKLAIKTRRVNSALADQLNAWKKLQNFRKPVIYGEGHTPSPRQNYSGYGPSMNPTGYGPGEAGPGGGLATGRPYMGGAPPIIPVPPLMNRSGGGLTVPPISATDAATFWRRMITGSMSVMRGGAYSSVIGANQFMGAFGNTATGGRALGAAGLGAGAGGAAVATGAILIALLAVAAAAKALQITIRESIAAAERARQLYAKAITNGLGLGLNAQRGNLASVLGVSENDIYQFGGALAFLNPRLQDASKIAADNAQALAPLSYELRILKIDIESLWTTIAADVVPALRFVVNLFDEMAKAAIEMYKTLKPLLLFAMNSMLPPGANKTKLLNDLDLMVVAIAGPMSGIIGRALADTMRGVGAPGGFMKQMPVSSFERMGLVANMGSGGLVDYARRTAVATETIARHIATGVPRSGSFGLDPNVSNP